METERRCKSWKRWTTDYSNDRYFELIRVDGDIVVGMGLIFLAEWANVELSRCEGYFFFFLQTNIYFWERIDAWLIDFKERSFIMHFVLSAFNIAWKMSRVEDCQLSFYWIKYHPLNSLSLYIIGKCHKLNSSTSFNLLTKCKDFSTSLFSEILYFFYMYCRFYLHSNIQKSIFIYI